ncbi:hypothetical protein IAU60_006901 [Kwoniella sp. DSM 27419]
MPMCLATAYKGGAPRTSTKLDPERIKFDRVPSTYEVVMPRIILPPLHRALEQALRRPDFPDRLFKPGGAVACAKSLYDWEVTAYQPSGETGVSHILKSVLFDHLNRILMNLYEGRGTRVWRVIGLGSTGRADWGLYINGYLCVIVEIKPHSVISTLDMVNFIRHVKNSPVVQRSWSKTPSKYANLAIQIVAEFAHDTAYRTVRWGVLLNESCLQLDPAGELIPQYSSTVLFARQPSSLAVLNLPFNDSTDIDTDATAAAVQRPIDLMLALSVLPLEEYAPPPYEPTTPSLPAVPAIPPEHQRTGFGHGTAEGSDGAGLSAASRPAGSLARSNSPHPVSTRTRSATADTQPGSHDRSGRGTMLGDRFDVKVPMPYFGSDAGFIIVPKPELATDGETVNVDLTTPTLFPSYKKYQYNRDDYTIDVNLRHAETTRTSIGLRTGQYGSTRSMNDAVVTQPSSQAPPPILILQPDEGVELTFDHLQVPLLSLDGPINWYNYRNGHDLPDPTRLSPSMTQPGEECIVLGSARGQGAVWKVYPVADDTRRVIKITVPSIYPDEPEEGEFSCHDVRASIKRELDLLTGPLAPLQGIAVPKVLGVYATCIEDTEVWAIMMEDCGEPVALDELLPHDKTALLRLYSGLHDHGVLHGDVRPSNWLQARKTITDLLTPARFYIIDFGQSLSLETALPLGQDWETLCAGERDLVRRMMGDFTAPQ